MAAGQVGDRHHWYHEDGDGFSGITEEQKDKAGGRLKLGTPLGRRLRNGARIANLAAGNHTNTPRSR